MRNYIYLFLIIISFTCGCKQTANEILTNNTLIKTDDLGREVIIPIFPKRIISLTPSISELLYTFVDSNRIIGRSTWCDYPAAIQSKPAINSYPLDIEALVRLKPDLILAKKGMISLLEIKKLEDLNQSVFVQEYDLMEQIRKSTQVLVNITQGDTLLLHRWMNQVSLDTVGKKKAIRFFAITSIQPIYVFGTKTFLSEIAESYGGINCIQNVENPYPTIDVEYIFKSNPEIFIFSSEENKKIFFETYPILKRTLAYQQHKLFVLDDSIMSRPGIRLPKLIKSLQVIFNS